MRVRPAPAGAPLRGLDRCRLRGRARAGPRRSPRPARCPTSTRLSDEHETRVSLALSGPSGARRTALERLPASCAGAADGCLVDLRLGGHRAGRRPPPRALGAAAAARRRGAARPAPGRAWEHGRFDGPVPARRAARPRHLVETLETAHTWAALGSSTGRSATRSSARFATRARPGSSCATSRTSTATARRSTSRSSLARAPRRRARAVASGQDGRLRRDRRRGRRRSPTTTRSAATTRPGCAPRSASRGRGAARGQGAPRPGRDHEPGQAAGLRLPIRHSSLLSPGAAPWPPSAGGTEVRGTAPRSTVSPGICSSRSPMSASCASRCGLSWASRISAASSRLSTSDTVDELNPGDQQGLPPTRSRTGL